jgi:Tfp pilus assembly protein PilN
MQPFFVSEEKLAKQAYRYDKRYRLAAFLLLVTISLQVPFCVLLYYQGEAREEEESRRGVALQNGSQISLELNSLKETEVQLGEIKSWEPILQGRMPASAVLGAVEQSIPPDVVLSRIAMEAENYRPITLSTGSFRVPSTYSITLEGEQKVPDPGVWERFITLLLTKLPPGSKLTTSDVGKDKTTKGVFLPCRAVLQAEANGNYFPLGVKRIDAEENL